jgi:hypothetical protein
MMRVAVEPISLETPVGEKDNSSIGDFVQSTNMPTPGDVTSTLIRREEIDGILGAARASGHFVASFLFGLKPLDPTALIASVLVLGLAALLAGYAPAWRASRIDPMVALRHE